MSATMLRRRAGPSMLINPSAAQFTVRNRTRFNQTTTSNYNHPVAIRRDSSGREPSPVAKKRASIDRAGLGFLFARISAPASRESPSLVTFHSLSRTQSDLGDVYSSISRSRSIVAFFKKKDTEKLQVRLKVIDRASQDFKFTSDRIRDSAQGLSNLWLKIDSKFQNETDDTHSNSLLLLKFRKLRLKLLQLCLQNQPKQHEESNIEVRVVDESCGRSNKAGCLLFGNHRVDFQGQE